MGGCFFGLAIICFIIGVIQLVSPAPANFPVYPQGRSPIPQPPQRSAPQAPAPAASFGGEAMIGKPQKLDWIRVGDRIYVNHPVKGEVMVHVLGRILYVELWQRTRGPQSPWVPTGNAFAGFWLEGNILLLNWQTRIYLLDESAQLSDPEIQRDFAPHAKKFAQSDQTAEVFFAYPPAMWKIEDIGKFRVDEVEGEGFRLRPGAVGRFIHASGHENRALVLEDYEGGGGGEDTVWTGYMIGEDAVRKE